MQLRDIFLCIFPLPQIPIISFFKSLHKFRSMLIFVIFNKIYAKLHTTSSNGTLVTAIKHKLNREFPRSPCCFTFYKNGFSKKDACFKVFYNIIFHDPLWNGSDVASTSEVHTARLLELLWQKIKNL